MEGVIVQVNVDGNNVLGVGYSEDEAEKDLYQNLYNIYEDKRVEEISFRIRQGKTEVVKEVPETVLFYASFSYNGEDMTERHVRKLEQEFKNTNLENIWGENWREKLRDSI